MGCLGAGLGHGLVDNGYFLADLSALTWLAIAMIVGERASSGRDKMPNIDIASSRPPISTPILSAIVTIAGVSVGLLAWQTTGLVLLIAVGAWLGMRHPDWGLGLLALTLPVQAHFEVGIQSGSVTLTKVVIWSLLGGWTIALLRSRQRVLVDFVTVSLFVLVAALVVSVWNARDGGIWIGETYRWLATAIVSCFAFNAYRRGGSPLPFLIASLVGVVRIGRASRFGRCSIQLDRTRIRCAGSCVPMVPSPTRTSSPFIWSSLRRSFWRCLVGPRGDLRPDGHWYLSQRLRPLWAVGVLAGMLGLVLSQSRGGIVGMAAGFAMVAALLAPRIRLSIVRLAPVGLIGALALLTISIGIVAAGVQTFANEETLVTPANFAVQERLSHWTAAVEMAKAHPFVGVGAGNLRFELS